MNIFESTTKTRICTCESCRYTFRYPIFPTACPDCGKKTVRTATDQEIEEYYKNQLILEREIREGLYPATA